MRKEDMENMKFAEHTEDQKKGGKRLSNLSEEKIGQHLLEQRKTVCCGKP